MTCYDQFLTCQTFAPAGSTEPITAGLYLMHIRSATGEERIIKIVKQ